MQQQNRLNKSFKIQLAKKYCYLSEIQTLTSNFNSNFNSDCRGLTGFQYHKPHIMLSSISSQQNRQILKLSQTRNSYIKISQLASYLKTVRKLATNSIVTLPANFCKPLSKKRQLATAALLVLTHVKLLQIYIPRSYTKQCWRRE